MAEPRLSIVIATYRRFDRLRRCIEHTRTAAPESYEFVIVEGGAPDGAADWLAAQPDVRIEVEADRQGCCRAYDRAFRRARGEFVVWLNDDSYPLPGALTRAIEFLQRPDAATVGMIALYHTHRQPWNELHGVTAGDGQRFGVLHVRGWTYANFGLLRRSLLEQVGFLDTGYRYCAWDPDLSLKVQRVAGLSVLGLPDARVAHEEYHDERKIGDAEGPMRVDNEQLFAKWSLPPKGSFPDPRPAYIETLRRFGVLSAADSATASSAHPTPLDRPQPSAAST